MLVLETSRVEIAVLLNDLAYLKYEKSKDSLDADTILLKQRNLGIAFSLVEKTIKLISSVAGDGGTHLILLTLIVITISEATITIRLLLLRTGNIISDALFSKIITGLNETVGVILEYLRDAKVLCIMIIPLIRVPG